MSERTIFLNSGITDDGRHIMMMGSSGKGKSRLLQQYAQQEGISYEEAERRCQPTKEELERRRNETEESRVKDAKRLQAVRDAYWSATDADSNEFSSMHDACTQFLGRELSHDQLKRVFDYLPGEIIGSGIKWGFDDTVVRDNIYEYIRDNAEAIIKCIDDLDKS